MTLGLAGTCHILAAYSTRNIFHKGSYGKLEEDGKTEDEETEETAN